MITPEQAIEGINRRYGRHAGARALHAKGIVCSGEFVAAPAAAELTRAPHMQGERIQATVRLSNGSGEPRSRDFDRDVRGLAATFHLPDGSRTDISAQTVPHFPVRTPDDFIELVQLTIPSVSSLVRFPLFVARHPSMLRTLRANAPGMKPPESFATTSYYGVHAFRWIAGDGSARQVRYSWRPEAGERRLGARDAKARGRDYLFDELRERLAQGPIRFQLEVTIAGDGDDPDDPTSIWKSDEIVDAGALEITGLREDGDELVFDPARVTDGIELSNDPILNFRPKAYDVSATRRLA